jgi:plasmid stabilization system protein ParE
MKVRWTLPAVEQLQAIHAYIARDSVRYAKRMIDRITKRSTQIARFPRSGQVVPEYQNENIREVIEGNYRVIYQIESDGISVVAVFHGAQLLPRGAPGSNPG